MHEMLLKKYVHQWSGMLIADKVFAGSIDLLEVPYSILNNLNVVHSWWQLKEGDIVYVGIEAVPMFLDCCGPDALPPWDAEFKTPIILMLGSSRFNPRNFKCNYFNALLKNKNIKAIIMTNPHVVHEKVYFFPYGIQNPVLYDQYYEYYCNLSNKQKIKIKRQDIFRGYFNKANNMAKRGHIECEELIPMNRYFEKLLTSKYVLSPDGDRPDQYRIWLALGLGCKPIVQWDDKLYGDVEDAVFNIEDKYWNNNEKLQENVDNYRLTNHKIVLLDYWKEKVKKIHEKYFPK